MVTINWTRLAEFKIDPGTITSPWLVALAARRDSTYLLITATGKWTPTGGELGQCGPDGLLGAPLQTNTLAVPDCPVGALIGKFGGSSANLTPVPPPAESGDPPAQPAALADAKSFAIGSHCVVAVPEKSIGPLYVSFNGLIRPVTIDETVVITISGATPTT